MIDSIVKKFIIIVLELIRVNVDLLVFNKFVEYGFKECLCFFYKYL